MNRIKKISQMIFLILITLILSQSQNFAADKKSKEKCYDEKNTNIEVQKNKSFTINVTNASSTEYTWELVQPIDKTKIKLLKKQFIKDKKAKKEDIEKKDKKGKKEDIEKKDEKGKKNKILKVTSGVQVYKFKAKAKGETTIKVKYIKKSDKTEQKTIEYKVKIN